MLPLLCSQVTGCLKMRTYLSGMPECKLGLNDKVRLHACKPSCQALAWCG